MAFSLDKILGSVRLASPPATALRVLEISRDPQCRVRDIVEVVKTDPALSLKVLHAANSSYYGVRSRITTLEQAVTFLGHTSICALTLSFYLVEQHRQSATGTSAMNFFWKNSLLHAVAAEKLARAVGSRMVSESFLAGLLANLGQLVWLQVCPECEVEPPPAEGNEIEQWSDRTLAAWNLDHCQLGAAVGERWKMPDFVVRAMRYHHRLNDPALSDIDVSADLVRFVHGASIISDYFYQPDKHFALDKLRGLCRQYWEVDEEQLQDLLERIRTTTELAAEALQVPSDQLPDPTQLLAEANEQLAQLTMRAATETIQAQVERVVLERRTKQLETENDELGRRADRDSLTTLYNRRYVDHFLRQALDGDRPKMPYLAVIFCDIDYFKNFNDRYGHAVGDEVIIEVGRVIENCVRSGDVVGRYGGEEFVVVAFAPDRQVADGIAQRIQSAVEALKMVCDGTQLSVTLSVGSVTCELCHLNSGWAEELIRLADQAMYHSKRSGRNRVTLVNAQPELYSPEVETCPG